jgi:pimeloyl-ACP methyl ester carboxylesterase
MSSLTPLPLPKSRLRRYSRAISIRLAVACAILFLAQDKIILRPDVGGSAATVLSQPGWATPWVEDGELLGNVYASTPAPTATVMVYHGNAGTIQNDEPLAQTLTSMGFRVVLVEYPGFGERKGWATMSAARNAAQDAFDRAAKKWPAPVYVLGVSFGAGMAAQVVKARPDQVAGVLLFTPWDSLYSLVNGKFLGAPVGLLLKNRFDSAEGLRNYRGKVELVGAGKDELIPVVHARALAKALPGAAYTELPGAGHNTWFYELSRRDWEKLMTNLGAHPAPSYRKP